MRVTAEAFEGRLFDLAWEHLSRTGGCDAVGSEEYERLRKIWGEEGALRAVVSFILNEANAPSDCLRRS